MGGASAHNAIMHSTSTKHGPAHPHDVDDVDGRWPHDVDERYTSAPHTQHEGAQPEHAQHGHAQQAGPQGPEHAHADDNRTSTLRSQHGHTGVRSIKRTAAGSAVPRPCLRSLAAVGRRHTGPGYNMCLPGRARGPCPSPTAVTIFPIGISSTLCLPLPGSSVS